MKKLKLTCMLMVLGIGTMFAQAPNLFNYQGVARDAKGAPIANQTLGLKLSVTSAEDATVADYEETQTATTNEFGLYTLKVGDGIPLNGTMEKINWESGNKYLKVSIDPKGGSNYSVVGNAQLLSVPYALFANKAKVAGSGSSRSGGVVTAPGTTGSNNRIPKFNGTPNTLTNSRILDNGSRIGFGTTSPVHDYSFYRPTTGNTVQIKSGASNQFSRLRFQADGTGSAQSELVFTKLGRTQTGTYMGLPRANLAAVNNNGLPGDYVIVGTRNFVMGTLVSGTPTERWRMTPDGKIGVGLTAPTAGLHSTRANASGFNYGFTTYPAIMGQNNSTGSSSRAGVYGSASGAGGNYGVFGNGVDASNTSFGVFARLTAAPATGISAGILAYDAVNNSNTRSLITRGGLAEFESETEFNNNATFNSPIQYTSGAPGLGKVLTSDASGNATWQTPSGGIGGTGITNRLTKWINSTTVGAAGVTETAAGSVGIGTVTPNSQLSVRKAITVGGTAINDIESGRLNFNENINSYTDTTYCGVGFHYNGATNVLKLEGGCSSKSDIMSWARSGGKVTIGTVASTPGSYRLYVQDGILTERVKVAVEGSGNWADYVFAPDYNLMPLEEVDQFIQKNKHLPNVPSAEKMAETGIDVATMDAKLMEKIEELTLYMIDMKKEIKNLKAQNETLKANLKK